MPWESAGFTFRNVKPISYEIMKQKIRNLLKELKDRLSRIYGDKLEEVILYGSYARGEATPDSDIDVAVVLKGRINPSDEINRIMDSVYELELKYNELISLYPTSPEKIATSRNPLILSIKDEGMVI